MVCVFQIGARRHYAVARGLAAVGRLTAIITDSCSEIWPWSMVPSFLAKGKLRRLVDRKIDGVPSSQIKGCLGFFLNTNFGKLRHRSEEELASHWARQNHAFCQSAKQKSWQNASTVYCYNGAALEIFEKAKKQGQTCVLDQTAAAWRYNTDLLSREKEKWREWEKAHADLDTSGEMIYREEAEWELADRIICGSQFVVDSISAVNGPVEKCKVVHYPTPNFETHDTKKSEHDVNKTRVLFLGTMQLRKGIQYLWQAAKDTEAHSKILEFRAVGPSSLTESANKKIVEQLSWVGAIPRTEVCDQFAWADVLVLPSLSARLNPYSRSNTLAKTPEETIAGAKRDPSSLVQTATSIGASVS